MSYTLSDVAEAKRRITAAHPDAIVDDWQDYGWKLTVTAPGLSSAMIVYQPEREDIGQREIIGSAESAIDWLAQSANRIGKDLANGG